MAKARTKQKSPFTGLWHFVSMTGWDEEYFNEEVQAFIEFEENGTGHFQFGYVSGYMDWRATPRDGEPAVEWSWEGGDGADGPGLGEAEGRRTPRHDLHPPGRRLRVRGEEGAGATRLKGT